MVETRSLFIAALLSVPCIAVAGAAGIQPKGIAISIGQSDARNESGVIDDDVEIEGVVIINGEVSIDGVPIPRGTKKYRSARTGKTYRIEWGKGDHVSVSEQ